MGTAELREAFNTVSEPAASCSDALMAYDQFEGKEWQVLRFRGTTAAGVAFDILSPRLPPMTDLNEAAKEIAQQLVGQQKQLANAVVVPVQKKPKKRKPKKTKPVARKAAKRKPAKRKPSKRKRSK
jgi:hypothetical protein